MSKNTKIVLLVILSIFTPFIGIPLLIVVLMKDKNQENTQAATLETINVEDGKMIQPTLSETNVRTNKIKNTSTSFPKKQLITLIIIVSCVLFIMLLGVVLTLTVPNGLGKTILEVSAFIEIFGAIIGFIFFYKKMYYTCPECGTKREHHRQFLETTSRQLVQNERDTSLTKRTVIYKHVYLDTYVCPKCGETMENRVTSDGGKIVYDYRDVITYDNTKPPKEF